jgi:2-aminoadipate transaminase
MNYGQSFSKVTNVMKSSLIRELVASTKNIPGLISFAGGFPAPATFPKELLAKLYQEVVSTQGSEVLQYGASSGDSQLIKELIKWEGFDLDPSEVLVTIGSTNAIYNYTRSLINPGDVILVEAPTFLGSLVVFDALEAEIQSVPIDDDGIDLNQLESTVKKLRAAGKNIKFLYTIPDFHNPGGVSMSLERRRELIAYADRENLAILEDNPYGRLRFEGEHLPTLYRVMKEEFPGTNVVSETVTFSKILGAGMRMAFMKSDKAMISKMESWQQKINVTPDCVSQRVTARFLADGHMEGHLKMISAYYKPFLDQMLKSLETHMPAEVKWTKPQGGIFLWMELPERMNADEIFHQAAEKKVSFIPGSKFYPEGQEKFNTLRLNFSYSSLEQIEEGIKRLGELLKAL